MAFATKMQMPDRDRIAGITLQSGNTGAFEVFDMVDFDRVMENFAKWKPDLVLMDLTLPFFNGYYWCSEIRKVSDAPIIVISSAGDDMNLVMAINPQKDRHGAR